ncbi:dihydrofolate reductase family protein [Actinomadura rudentiformis]|uniref:Dihydrofolate reductase n=1 Tax=Actinomadura rudentiformis TaxID=359158 RepID=A0A6H9YU37_9ACTN|nr:dihydrofolate reductase family protein [Actinomadura rudentiformis]KAB2349114.1 dihydrofolate reductase [Actinomadura rudentiformis]
MSKVFSALSVSVDGYITGREPSHGRGLGDGGVLFNWYGDGDTPSKSFEGFRLSAESASVFDELASSVGAIVCGRNTYDDSGWSAGGKPHPTAPLVVLSHRPAPASWPAQTFVSTGIEEAIAVARKQADGKDVGLQGGGVVTEALKAGLVDELVLHQVPVLLGGGRPYFQALPGHIGLELVKVVPAPGVTHIHYRVVR